MSEQTILVIEDGPAIRRERGNDASQKLFVGPGAAAAGLASDDQVQAGDEGNQLAAAARFETGVARDALVTAHQSGQFPSVGKRTCVAAEGLNSLNIMRRQRSFAYERFRYYLPIGPTTVA